MKPARPEQRNRLSRFAADIILTSPHRQLALLQFAFYLVVGGICFSIDIVGFVALRYFDLPILTASAISFVAATITNYLLCCAWVFRSGRFSRSEEVFRLFIIALVGLALNSAAVWLLAEILRFNPTLAKIIAVFPILGWNYLGRRVIVFDETPAAVLVTIAERVRARYE